MLDNLDFDNTFESWTESTVTDPAEQLTYRTWNVSKARWDVTGIPQNLKRSQKYTRLFGQRIVRRLMLTLYFNNNAL